MISAIVDGTHGPTTYDPDPTMAAYHYAHMLRVKQDRRASFTFHEGGAVTVESVGLMPMTFETGE